MHSSNLLERLRADGVDARKVDYGEAFVRPALHHRLEEGIRILFRLFRLRWQGAKLFHFHASNQALAFYLYGPLLALTGATLVLSIHSGYGFNRWLEEHPVNDQVNRLLFRFLDRLIFMNPEEQERIARRYPFLADRILTFNPFIAPVEAFTLRARPRMEVGKRPFRIMTIGAWAERYNVEEAVVATLHFAREIGERVHITVVQSTAHYDEAYRDRLLRMFDEARAEIDVELIENSSSILSLLADHDVQVRASKWDSYGLCVAESLLVGTPVLATDICRRCAAARLYRQGDEGAILDFLHEAYRQRGGDRRNMLTEAEDSYNGYSGLYQTLRK